MIRRAVPDDCGSLVALALEALVTVDIGDLLVERRRIRLLATNLVSDPSCLVLVHEENMRLTGAIALSVSAGLFFERKAAAICFWYATVPGTGRALLREALRWALARPAIKAVGASFDFGCDPRVGKILERAGLRLRGQVYARY